MLAVSSSLSCVSVPPYIIDKYSSSDITITEGETVSLICNATGIPPPEVSWFKVHDSARKERESM